MNIDRLKKIGKYLLYWCVPQGIFWLLYRQAMWWALPWGLSRQIRGNKKYRNIHKGERCFIMATGPSVASQDLTVLKNEICFAVGEFHFHKEAGMINPRYCVLSPNHAPWDDSYVATTINGPKRTYSDNTVYFMGHRPFTHSYYSVLRKNSKLKPLNACFLNYSGSVVLNEYNYDKRDSWDIAKTPFAMRTVVYSAIQLAVYMGFSKIYLLGCDLDYLQRKILEKGFENHHFYKDKDQNKDGYVSTEGVIEYLNDFNYEKWFEWYCGLWKEYRLMGEYAKKNGQMIINATEGGMLDVFERVNFEDLFKP